MASKERKIKPDLKRLLVEQAGGKCANPGCAYWRTHIHHIKQWAVYKAHDSADMIAICPSCHDAIHHGRLAVSDETVYSWKGIDRGTLPLRIAHIHVEPAPQLRLLTGSIAISPQQNQMAVFDLSNTNRLTLRVLDGDMLQVNARLENQAGKEVLRVVENVIGVARGSQR